ncbi:M42 family metallopeptidase [Candidatus Nanohalococcus occultus]|uniref:M42 glutamyl aminopeptidase n=1 Tax=Candidatus Nanohalococcus occultus TaxID=2978047 RepID=A0ABY8CCV7_9ARCH|nr:M42 glutamyl aminopeptidase [Candidatus Nanohaloarchaeota archaeon SVXNc]
MNKLLKKLVETPSVSGDESEIRELIKNEIEDEADSIETDNFGNLVARKGKGDKTLMLMAHMDQIGLTVKNITEDGFIKFSKVGGVTTQSLMNQRVDVHGEEDIKGVIGMKPPHLMDKEERDKLPEKKTLFIDIGAEDKEEAQELVSVGDFITFERELENLQNDYYTSLAMDNRVGCLVGIKALERFDEDFELAVVFSTQEEVGLKGAKTSTFSVNPDAALAVDVSIAGDVPGVQDDESTLKMGGGVEITLVQSNGRGLITPESVKTWLLDTAEDYEHEHQPGVWEGGATDAASIELERSGVPTGSIGVPLRNMHSSTEIVKLSDIEDTVAFLEDSFAEFENHF